MFLKMSRSAEQERSCCGPRTRWQVAAEGIMGGGRVGSSCLASRRIEVVDDPLILFVQAPLYMR